MRILWLSQHRPLPVQVAELKRLFGQDLELVVDDRPFANDVDIRRRFGQGQFDELVLVAPLSVIKRLIEGQRLKPLWAEMETVQDPRQAHLSYRGRHYRFVKFRRIVAVELKFEELEPRS